MIHLRNYTFFDIESTSSGEWMHDLPKKNALLHP